MVKITVVIEGMVCGMCEAHINEAVRNALREKGTVLCIQEVTPCSHRFLRVS